MSHPALPFGGYPNIGDRDGSYHSWGGGVSWELGPMPFLILTTSREVAIVIPFTQIRKLRPRAIKI